ncbi:MAG: RNA polymerase sigma factor [Planctomycetaceae bacterium]
MPVTEQLDLAQRLLQDDEQVLEDVLRVFGPSILAVLGQRYRDVLRRQDIEDVLSIGLFRMWTNRARFDAAKASLKVWLFRIVENAARDVLRHGWHKARSMEVTGELALFGAKQREPVPSSESEEQTKAAPTALQMEIREIVSGLSANQRYIVMADAATRDGTACSRMLGEELGMPAATVRVYRKRAMDKIKKQLRDRGHEVP